VQRPLRVAVVGAGPSGLYAADALSSQQQVAVEVDLMDRLPVPFGLVRYGVAPDHLPLRGVRDTLGHVMEREQVRFLGGVEVGENLSIEDLRRHYDAIVLTYGAARDRALGIPGEDLTGSIAATDLVNWYCGHPDAPRELIESALQGVTSVVVVGVGNVAVDVTRVLAKTLAELDHTDMPQHVLDVLSATTITDVHVLGRRGPAQASWTTKELKELGELSAVDVVVDADPDQLTQEGLERLPARNLQVLQQFAARASAGKPRRIHLHFCARPVALNGAERVDAVEIERTVLDAAGNASGTGDLWKLPAQLVVRSVGYRGVALPGVPFDDRRYVVPNIDGRVLDGDAVAPGLYVAGWIKRGPSGIIGTNKKDASATVASLLADAAAGTLPQAAEPDQAGWDALLTERGVTVIDHAGWRAVDAAERALGESRGRVRTTIHDRADLVDAAGRAGS
jgi:ferredoxin--NADP+ reductase